MTARELSAEMKLDAHIDKHLLDEECVQQAVLYAKWSGRLAHAQENLRNRELKLTQYKATSMMQGKEDKYTDKMSEARYRTSLGYTELNTRIARLERHVSLMQAGVHTMLHRRSALECLCKLRVSDYYSL